MPFSLFRIAVGSCYTMIRILCKMLHKKSAINAIHINCAEYTHWLVEYGAARRARARPHSFYFVALITPRMIAPIPTNPLLKLKISPAVNGFLYFLIGTYTSAPAVNLGYVRQKT